MIFQVLEVVARCSEREWLARNAQWEFGLIDPACVKPLETRRTKLVDPEEALEKSDLPKMDISAQGEEMGYHDTLIREETFSPTEHFELDIAGQVDSGKHDQGPNNAQFLKQSEHGLDDSY